VKKFNLSEWALGHRSLVWYFMFVFMAAGVYAYLGLGREEDPSFSIKTMTITVTWPGATVEETLNQVTDRVERKLEELDTLDFTRSVTTPGQTTVFVNLKSTTRGPAVTAAWTQVRNMIGDIQSTFPQGVLSPSFNDRFGDVYGNIYAFTADGFTNRQLRDYVEAARSKMLTVPNAGRIDLIGAQNEVIYLEFSTRKLAALGLNVQQIIATLQAQNAVTPSGVIEAGPERIALRVGGQFTSEDSIRNINLRVNDRFFRLSDVATISRGYTDPPSGMFRFNGEPAIGLAVGMKPNANLLEFGKALDHELNTIVADLPVGIGVHLVSDQPLVVEEAVSGFVRALFEAVVIVLIVSFVSLGVRAGFIVSLSIPLVLAITFLVMWYFGISMQRISLGALIIALGLLVDDAMIAVEMMVARLEQGDPIEKAATYVYTSTAFPMLTGTLVTVAGFIPVGLNSSAAGEFTFTLFVVIGVSLLVSWVVAVLFAPLLGVTFLPRTMKKHAEKPSWFANAFARFLEGSMRMKWITIAVTLAMFAASLYGLGFVQQQFFPSSDRPELIVDWNLPQNSSIRETERQIATFEKEMLEGNKDIERWSSYVGQGAVRFVLSFDVQPPAASFGQTIIVSKGLEVRDQLKAKLQAYLKQKFPGTDALVKLLDIGPPVGRPLQYRVSGPDIQKVRDAAMGLAEVLGRDKRLGDVIYDWNEPARVVKIEVLQDKARQLGVSSEDIANALNGIVGGVTVTQVRDSIYLVNVIGRAEAAERKSIATLQDLQLSGSGEVTIPLAAIAKFDYDVEQPVVWRRARIPTITVKAGIVDTTQPATVVAGLKKSVDSFAATLPAGYSIDTAGTVEESAKGQAPIIAIAPLMLLAMTTILMVQLQSFQRLFLVFAVAPLGLIGVVAFLLPLGAPMGFVALLGVLALIGILIRNSVILIVQIEDHRRAGMDAWASVLDATEHRMRPIILTAAAASLALIPIAREIFWGPMAIAMMGGIIVGTVLTLIFLPALYVAWFRIKPPQRDDKEQAPAGEPEVATSSP
jgi:multidrug efflux pump subunit AcrB